MTNQPVIIGRRVWAGGYDPALTIWLHDSPHHWDDDQLVLHDEGREIRPEPGWLIVLWSDGMANAASPRVAERVYQPQPRPPRVPLDHLTSDQYDELCADLDRYEEIQGGMNEHAIDLARRAGLAEEAVERVSAECARIEAAVRANPTDPDFDGAYLAAVKHIRTALDAPKEPTP